MKDNFVEITKNYWRENKRRKGLEEEWSYFYKIEQIPFMKEAMGLQIIAFREGRGGRVKWVRRGREEEKAGNWFF